MKYMKYMQYIYHVILCYTFIYAVHANITLITVMLTVFARQTTTKFSQQTGMLYYIRTIKRNSSYTLVGVFVGGCNDGPEQ